MAKEIERGFLLRDMSWLDEVSDKSRIANGYLSPFVDPTPRVRIKGDKGYLTIKGKSEGAVCDEFEYEIPVADAEAMIDAGMAIGGILDKTRHLVHHEGLVWEIDAFHGPLESLFKAEVEIPSEDHPVVLPPWVGKEVTDDHRYKNSHLAKSGIPEGYEAPGDYARPEQAGTVTSKGFSAFSNALSGETLRLLGEVERHPDLKIAVYTRDNWAVENAFGPGALSFNPQDDSEHLRECIRRAVKSGRV